MMSRLRPKRLRGRNFRSTCSGVFMAGRAEKGAGLAEDGGGAGATHPDAPPQHTTAAAYRVQEAGLAGVDLDLAAKAGHLHVDRPFPRLIHFQRGGDFLPRQDLVRLWAGRFPPPPPAPGP